MKEAKRVGGVKIAASTEAENFARVPRQNELTLDPAAAYVHYTTNNTIFGTEFHYVPEVGTVPLVADASSDMFSGPIDVVEVRADLRRRAEEPRARRRDAGDRPRRHARAHADVAADDAAVPACTSENKSMYNTPPVFAIYIMRLVLAWLLKQGGLAAIETAQRAQGRQALRARSIAPGSIAATRSQDSRSRMNVTFRLPSEELEKKFAKEATAAGLDGLKGHRSVGGMRASIYNAFPEAGVDALVQFMAEFERRTAR